MTYYTIAADGSYETDIKKSRFICQMKRIENEEDGRDFIAQVKKKHYKASHSCSAMIIGQGSEIKRSSDDGEPSGTAGIPMLTVLEKQELTNVVAVITRYFGGIKLGAGGLIRAYSGTLADAIEELGKVCVTQQTILAIELTYAQYQTFQAFADKENLTLLTSDFGQVVTSQISLAPERVAAIEKALTDYYHGPVPISELGQDWVELPL